MSFLFVVCIIVLALIVALLLFASTRPANFHVERTLTIDAPPEKIFPLIDDFRQWDAWTPFDKDPAMTKTYSGSATGKGAHFAWAGNRQAGVGEITITDSIAPHTLRFDLHMIKPFEGRNQAAIHLKPEGAGTRVTWSLDDRHRLLLKTMRMFMNLDRLIGRDFEVGLARLKTLAETREPSPEMP